MTPNDHEAGKVSDLTRPILGIENRTAHEVFSIMCDRITRRAESQTGAVAGDYFGNLVARARTAAAKASAKYPQPNYIALKIAEESGEVVRGAVHYAEGRMEWSEVEGEIVQLLAMLFRFVTEGDQVIGVSPPSALEPTPIKETWDDGAECWAGCDDPNCPYIHGSSPIKETASPAVPADVQVVAWLDAGTAYEPWHRKIVATNPNYVENNGGLGKFEPLVRHSDYQRLAAENERLTKELDALNERVKVAESGRNFDASFDQALLASLTRAEGDA